jgi:hypothetical protein
MVKKQAKQESSKEPLQAQEFNVLKQSGNYLILYSVSLHLPTEGICCSTQFLK